MPRRDEVGRAFAPVDRDRHRSRSVGCGYAGGDTFARLDRDGEGGFVSAAVVAAHQLEPEIIGALLGQREADQPAAVRRHEVDRVGRCHLRGDHEVALVLAILVVDENKHAPVARLVDDLLDRHERGAFIVRKDEPLELAECFRGRVPSLVHEVAQGVGVKPSCARQAGTGHAAFTNEAADASDEIGRHFESVSHCDVIC